MSRPVSIVDADFKEVVAYLNEVGVIAGGAPRTLLPLAKSIHKSTYSLVLWRFRLKKLPLHGQVFLDEIASDAIQILPQVLMGYSKTAMLLVRGITENVLRHIYFSDHPVEFQVMNRERKWYLSNDDLTGYLKRHPRMGDLEIKFDAMARLTSLHSDLSAGVHGRTVEHLETRKALREIHFDSGQATELQKGVARCAECANFLLAAFHRDKIDSFSVEEWRVIARSMPPLARSTVMEMEL